MTDAPRLSLLARMIRFCVREKLIVSLVVVLMLGWAALVAPFDWDLFGLPRSPVPVDAIPDLGENQQIIFTEWPGHSPQDVEDQVTYPLTVALLGVPGVKTVRSNSMFGFSSIYVIFEEGVEFYWSRSRLLEKLASLPRDTLPEAVQPVLGPDATPLGQVYWYTLEGRSADGEPTGGWGLQELRAVQDWYVRYALASAQGISEIASVGGFVQEYQIDVDPDAMRAHHVALQDVFEAVRNSNLDVGARTLEINRVEYIIRGLGFVKGSEDLEQTVVRVHENVPIYVKDVARVSLGPAQRRGALDKEGAEAVGGVAVARYGENPKRAIANLKAKIAEISPGLPAKALIARSRVSRAELEAFASERGFRAFDASTGDTELDQEAWVAWLRSTRSDRESWPEWLALSQLEIVPFYDRTKLINETLDTLSDALFAQLLVTILVVVLMVFHLRSSLLISMLLPLAVGMCFILMKLFRVEANIVALSGIAIAIGTIVDVGIVICENVLKRLDEAAPDESRFEVVCRATSEVSGAVLTAVATTVVGFLPVFYMTGAEGKLFRPLAFTKTFALAAAVLAALFVLPAVAHAILGRFDGLARSVPRWLRLTSTRGLCLVVVVLVLIVLSRHWTPLGPEAGLRNFAVVTLAIVGLLLLFWLAQLVYPTVLRWCLDHKLLFLSVPFSVLAFGTCVWIGFERVFWFVPESSSLRETVLWRRGGDSLPGLGKEFMPALDEGAFLYMPSTMAHASIGESLEALQLQDRAIRSIPEVESVVGKIGRVESPLDPAPIGMVETVVNYKSEYGLDADGERVRQWRDHIESPDDIWSEIVARAQVPGSTSAPKLQPISTRLVMLQSGMRAPMGVKVKGPDLATIERVGYAIEEELRRVPGVEPASVFADRIVGKPYLELELDREALARYGLSIGTVQEVIEVAVGGKRLTTTVEGRERYPVRVRYGRELRGDTDALGRILVPTAEGAQIPLRELAELNYVRGPQAIKSEDTFLVGYVIFDKQAGWAEVDVVDNARRHLDERVASGELQLPEQVSYTFAGSYENQVHAQKTLRLVLPIALAVIFLILYLQFRSITTSLMVWSGVAVAWAGGFMMLWFYGQPWFLDLELFGSSLRDVFQIEPKNLSVAVWVGFLALFGIATDDGVVIGTYLRQSFERASPGSIEEIRGATLEAGKRRARACLMTTATTILALLPVLTSTGRGADIMIPMAIPSFGGMVIALMTMLLVPVLYCWWREIAWHGAQRASRKL